MKWKKVWVILLVFFWVLLANGPCLPVEIIAGSDTGKKDGITIDYRNADIADVLRSLAYSYNLNLVTPQDIKGKVDMSLVNVSVDEALSAILGTNGYAFTRKNNLIYITPGPGLEGIDVVTERIPLRFLVASEANALLQKVISPKGDMKINESTNSLVITDFPESIEKVKKVLGSIDIAPIQVLIEAKLVDITEKNFENFGITYTVDYKPLRGGLFNRPTKIQEEIADTINMAGPSSTLSGGQMKMTPITFKNASGSVTLDALIQANKAHVLASPSITTLNGKEARIIIGERYPYFEKTQTTTGTIQSTKFADIGTTLRVVPRVSPDGWITMIVHPEVSTLTAALDAGPRISTREADATIRVRDGETIVIGGLIRREDNRIKGKMPIVGDIPLLGWLFKKASADLSSTELVVFITPRIVRSPEDIDKARLAAPSEAAVSIDGVGIRATVNKLLEEALDLERGRGLISLDKDKATRMADALEHYKQIISQFSGSDKADYALYRQACIVYDYYHDLVLAKELFTRLFENYKNSFYASRARNKVEQINKKIAANEKRIFREKHEP